MMNADTLNYIAAKHLNVKMTEKNSVHKHQLRFERVNNDVVHEWLNKYNFENIKLYEQTKILVCYVDDKIVSAVFVGFIKEESHIGKLKYENSYDIKLIKSVLVDADFQSDYFLNKSVLKISNIFADECLYNFINDEKSLLSISDIETICRQNNMLPSVLTKEKLKAELRKFANEKAPVGRGYVVDLNKWTDQEYQLLLEEYLSVAWGELKWAKNTLVADDEVMIINKYIKGDVLEIGAGSGRVTKYLIHKAQNLTATDIISNFATHFSNDLIKPNCIVDNILRTQLPEKSFDIVSFWENGLGMLKTFQERKNAVHNMCRLVRDNGFLIIAVRQLIDQSADQLMIAAQTDLVMGVAHTFGKEEITACLPNSFEISELIKGDSRPAGGQEVFYIIRRSK
jgi:hypothetical protein